MFLRRLAQRRLTRQSLVALGTVIPLLAMVGGNPAIAQVSIPTVEADADLCTTPALKRLKQHSVGAGETLASIAYRYGLTPATLEGFNPTVRGVGVATGQALIIPPYNGIRITAQGRTWEDLSAQYSVRPDVLFEVNGCADQPTTAFIPGVKWEPGVEEATVMAAVEPGSTPGSTTGSTAGSTNSVTLSGYPLRQPSRLATNYGWQLNPILNRVVFHGGIDIAAAVGDAVLAVGDGTVAYAAEQGEYGKLVVVNHANGLQSRYAQLSNIQVSQGQKITRNTQLGRVGQTGVPSHEAAHLHFEMRLNSTLGWVAQDPTPFLSEQVGLGE